MDARGDMTRKELCEKLNKCNIYHPDKEISEDVLKMWELGRNTINIEWIPAICHVLHCDTGYLFGEYKEKTYISCDIHEKIGLDENVIALLYAWNKHEPHFPVLLSRLIFNNYFIAMLRAIRVYIGEVKTLKGIQSFEDIAESFTAYVTDDFLDKEEGNIIKQITKETLIKQVICDCLWKSIKTMTN